MSPADVARVTDLQAIARELDARDPLAHFAALFERDAEVVSYLDGNSLGRPLRSFPDRVAEFTRHEWGSRLIRSWDESWMTKPFDLGDRLGRATLGAATGQTLVGDSTTVLLYKVIRAAVRARPGRTEIMIDDDNFPTDRFIVEGIADECGLTITWIRPDRAAGVTVAHVREALSERTAVVILSHVAYRSGYVADVATITDAAHRAGALVVWDLCHSAGVIPTSLDEWDVDLAVGCTYKYLNGGPGSPAFAYVRRALQHELHQPIQGWMGAADVFAMGDEYRSASDIRGFASGTPPVLAMLAIEEMLALIEEAGIDAIREKSIRLTDFAENALNSYVLPLGAILASPPAGTSRGSHLTVRHDHFRGVTASLWKRGVIPDFRSPDAIRVGLSPLSTTYEEVETGIRMLGQELERSLTRSE